MEQPVDVMETAEGAVAELVTRAGDQWRLRLGTNDAVGTGDRRVSARIDAATPGTAEPGNLVSGSSAEVFFGQYRCPLIG